MENILQVSWLDVQGIAEYEGRLGEATVADLTIRVGSTCLTRHASLTRENAWRTRESVRLCLHPLAYWFAWNFYRLLYEPMPETQDQTTDLEWLAAHDMAYVGDGFLWPPIRIYAEGENVVLCTRAQTETLEPIRYASSVPVTLPVQAFEDQMLLFLETCDIRLRDKGISSSPFQSVYTELKAELADESVRQWRRSEAMLGRNPDAEPQNP